MMGPLARRGNKLHGIEINRNSRVEVEQGLGRWESRGQRRGKGVEDRWSNALSHPGVTVDWETRQ